MPHPTPGAARASPGALTRCAPRAHAPSLHRLMRTLAGLGILTERDAQRFALTPLGEALKSGAPGSARATLIAFCGPSFWHSWEEILYSVETGKTGFEKACGMPLFEYLAQHPEEASYCSEAMVGFHGAEPPAVAKAYDFSADERHENRVSLAAERPGVSQTMKARETWICSASWTELHERWNRLFQVCISPPISVVRYGLRRRLTTRMARWCLLGAGNGWWPSDS